MPLNFDEDALKKMLEESDGFKQLQADGNERIRSIVRSVNTSHAGMPVGDVDSAMRAKFAEGGIEPKEPDFTEIVEAISRGEMTN